MTLAVSIAFAVTGLVIMGIALRVVFQSLNPSSILDYRKCKGGWWEAELNHCATGLTMVPQQPVNTYTNLAYVAVGLFLIFQLNTLPSYILSLTLLYLCVGSALYHATSTRWAGSLDVSAIYAVFSAMAIYAASTLTNLEDSVVAFIMFVVAVLSAYFLRFKYRGNMQLKIGIFFVLTYSLAIWSMLKNNKLIVRDYLIASFILSAIAFIVWNLDLGRIFPLRRWGHGLWHVLTAAAISILFYGIYLITQ
jgi:hypothetical protein